MLARVQININDCRVWSFFNEIGALAQCPHNWGVGSAFHPMKIHIIFDFSPLCVLKCLFKLLITLIAEETLHKKRCPAKLLLGLRDWKATSQ